MSLALFRSGVATVPNSNLANEVSAQREQYLAAEQEAGRERVNPWGVAPLRPSPPSRNQQPSDTAPISGATTPE